MAIRQEENAHKDLQAALALNCKEAEDHYDRAVACVLTNNLADGLIEFGIPLTDPNMRQMAEHDDILESIRDLPAFRVLLDKYQ